MFISLRWLNEYVDVKDFFAQPEVLGEELTRAGLEVENITNRAKDFQYVVTGLILEKDKHPNADKLSLCRVSTGEGVVHQIVCGAQNHKAGDRVIVALPGAVLPGNFVIKQSKIRDVESGGMLCSDKELGLAKESQGITILPADAPIGKPFAEYAGLDDVTFELKVTPNRADCLSHFGLAREVACLLNRNLKPVKAQFNPSAKSTQSEIALEVRESVLCPRYAGRYISGVKVGPSPDWLKKRLEAVGLNSINNIVDVTNFVMFELGQPLHAFDAKEIKGRKIIVEKARAQEKFTTLDGTELTLTGEELMIRDSERAVAMAGVVGGKNSGVTDATTEIFVEAAYFNPMAVRKASRLHGVNTDSGYRFSRGVDPENTVRAMDRACDLIAQVAGGEIYDQNYDIYPNPEVKKPITIKIQTVANRLGYVVDPQRFSNFMGRLGCAVEQLEQNEYSILPPAFRFDLEHDMDLVEEYARLHGYEHIPETVPMTSVSPAIHDQGFVLSHQVSKIFVGQGYYQALNMAFASEKSEQEFILNKSLLKESGLMVSEKPIKLLNPLSDDLNVMRSALSFGLFKNMTYNFHQGNETGRLFEIGKTFYLSESAEYLEQTRLALMAWGYRTQFWDREQKHPLIFEVKSAVEELLAKLKIKSYQWLTYKENACPKFLHQGQAVLLQVEGKVVGFIGTLHPVLVDENKIRVPVALAELNLDQILQGQPRVDKFQSVSKQPVVERDLALVMKRDLAASDVLKEMKKLAGANLIDLSIFDLYEGDKIDAGLKSVAFRLKYQDKNATLQDEVINKSIESVLAGLKQKFSISVR